MKAKTSNEQLTERQTFAVINMMGKINPGINPINTELKIMNWRIFGFLRGAAATRSEGEAVFVEDL